jgi:hypothetical protein
LITEVQERPEAVEEFRNAAGPWLDEIDAWKTKHPMSYKQETTVIKPQLVIQKLRELSDDGAIIATDVGQHQMWTAQFFGFTRPRTFLTSGGLGTMGFGLPPRWEHSRFSGQAGNCNLRRRRVSDEYAGTCNPCAEPLTGENLHLEQQLPGNGSTVARAFL